MNDYCYGCPHLREQRWECGTVYYHCTLCPGGIRGKIEPGEDTAHPEACERYGGMK